MSANFCAIAMRFVSSSVVTICISPVKFSLKIYPNHVTVILVITSFSRPIKKANYLIKYRSTVGGRQDAYCTVVQMK
jgi:hypothetical protein